MLFEAAAGYIRLGWLLIVLHGVVAGRCTCRKACGKNAGKHPRFKDWQALGTTDLEQLAAQLRRSPDSNLGLVTGARTNTFVLDVDGDEGAETLAALERRHGSLPETVTALTGGGGRQLLFAHPGFAVSNNVNLWPGVDLRGDRGLIVLPPSLHRSRRRYAWAIGFGPEQLPIAPAPPWLLDMLRAADRDRLRRDGTPPVLREGERNWRLFQLACALRRYGVNEEAISACLTAINKEHCDPRLSSVELATIAKSTTRYRPEAIKCRPTMDPYDAALARALGVGVRG